jgi:hypothetical protein
MSSVTTSPSFGGITLPARRALVPLRAWLARAFSLDAFLEAERVCSAAYIRGDGEGFMTVICCLQCLAVREVDDTHHTGACLCGGLGWSYPGDVAKDDDFWRRRLAMTDPPMPRLADEALRSALAGDGLAVVEFAPSIYMPHEVAAPSRLITDDAIDRHLEATHGRRR